MTYSCQHHTDGVGVCGASPTRLYLTGRRCPNHTPARVAGRPEVTPDPALTLDGLRAAAGADVTRSYTPTSPTGIDRAAVKSGKRRSTAAEYREARR